MAWAFGRAGSSVTNSLAVNTVAVGASVKLAPMSVSDPSSAIARPEKVAAENTGSPAPNSVRRFTLVIERPLRLQPAS